MRNWILKASPLLVVPVLAAGCVVNDGKPDEELPIWYPAFVVKGQRDSTPTSTTRPAAAETGAVYPAGGGAGGSRVAAESSHGNPVVQTPTILTPVELRPPIYTPAPGVVTDGNTQEPPNAGPPPATLYPTRGEAAVEASSATLYPPRGVINPDPARNPTLYPSGPAGPRGYVGN